MFVRKNSLVQINVGSKKIWLNKNFGPKKILVRKKICLEQNFGPKNVWSEKDFWSRQDKTRQDIYFSK